MYDVIATDISVQHQVLKCVISCPQLLLFIMLQPCFNVLVFSFFVVFFFFFFFFFFVFFFVFFRGGGEASVINIIYSNRV